MGFKGVITLTFFISSCLVWADGKLNTPEAMKYKKALAKKLERLNQDPDVKEGSFSGYQKGTINPDDQNPELSTSTYHSFVWDYCQRWITTQRCGEWLHPYISKHGMTGDSSPVESAVFAAYQQNKNGGGGGLSIWDVTSRGNYLNVDGTINRENLTSWRVKKDLSNKLKDIGSRTAKQAVWRTLDKNDKKNATVMPNMESLRRMAGSFSKMMRNRFVAGIGQIRAMQPGVEFALGGAEINSCRQYMGLSQQNREQTQGEDRLEPQNKLAIQTRVLNRRIDDRARICQEMLGLSVYAVNPKVYGQNVRMAGPGREWIDSALYRANLVAMDFAGADPRQMVPLDKRLEINDNDLKSDIVQYENGGLKYKTIKMSNAEQLKLYNQSLDKAAAAIEKMSARLGYASQKNGSARTRAYKIKPKGMNVVMINDLTPDMRLDLKGTGYKQSKSPASKSNEPGNQLEMTPIELMAE